MKKAQNRTLFKCHKNWLPMEGRLLHVPGRLRWNTYQFIYRCKFTLGVFDLEM